MQWEPLSTGFPHFCFSFASLFSKISASLLGGALGISSPSPELRFPLARKSNQKVRLRTTFLRISLTASRRLMKHFPFGHQTFAAYEEKVTTVAPALPPVPTSLEPPTHCANSNAVNLELRVILTSTCGLFCLNPKWYVRRLCRAIS